MRSLTLDEILEDLERFPKTRHMATYHDSLESPYVALMGASSSIITQLAKQPIVNAFRRVLLDPVSGFIMLMSPSSAHEVLGEEVNQVVNVAAERLGLENKPLGATRWRRQGDPDGTGVEPDKCYYVGENARRFLAADDVERRDFVDEHPPDLVVEVTISHFDEQKIYSYRDRGVPEFWQVRGEEGCVPRVSFLDLRGSGEPLGLSASLALPNFTPEALQRCLEVGRGLGPAKYAQAVCDVLDDYGVMRPTRENRIIGGIPTSG